MQGRRRLGFRHHLLHLFHGGAQRDAGREVEGDGDGGKLAEVRDRHGTDVACDLRDGAELDQAAGRRADVELRERRDVLLKFRLQFHDDPVLVGRGVNSRNLP